MVAADPMSGRRRVKSPIMARQTLSFRCMAAYIETGFVNMFFFASFRNPLQGEKAHAR
jgi:hypothetical protein